MRAKVGVGLRDLKPQTLFAMSVTERVCLNHFGLAYEPTITSCDDSHDAGLHPSGFAFDVRTKDILPGDRGLIFRELKRRLEPLGYDVLWEFIGGPREHFHIEYDPKPTEP